MAELEIRDRVKEIRKIRAGDLMKNPKNWRVHPQAQTNAMKGILRELGAADVLKAYPSGETMILLDGHLRSDVAPDFIWNVAILDFTDAEADEYLVTHDTLTGMAEADTEKLKLLIDGVKTEDKDLASMLEKVKDDYKLPEDELPDLEEDTDEIINKAEELRKKWGVESGQMWQLGEHRIICGDCTDRSVVDRVMGGERAHVIFTDPPYGVNYDGGAKKREKLNGDHIGTEIYSLSLPVLANAADDEAPLYLWYADGHAAAAAAAAAAAGYQITAQIIWAKNQAQFVTSAHYKGKHEPCYYAHKKGKSARWYGPNNEVTLWEYDRSPRNDYHPTQKPVELAERAIRNSSKIGEIVVDGFSGGGTTLIACERLKRKCRAVEISPAYVAVAIQRWVDLTNGTPELIN